MTRRTVHFERRHFNFLADALASIQDDDARAAACNAMCAALRVTNDRFDAGRFVCAVMKQEGNQ